jgi:hypothetical protein
MTSRPSERRCVLSVCFPLHPNSNLWCHFPYILTCQTRVYGLFMCLKFRLPCSKFADVKSEDSQYLASQCCAMQTKSLRQRMNIAFDTLHTNKRSTQPWQLALPRQIRVCAHTRQRSQTSDILRSRHSLKVSQPDWVLPVSITRTSSAWRAPTMNLPHIIIQTFI